MGKSTRYAIEHEQVPPASGAATERSQAEKFIEAARELGCDESEEAFAGIVQRVAGHRHVQHASDCAVCDAPAYEAGACTCGAATAER